MFHFKKIVLKLLIPALALGLVVSIQAGSSAKHGKITTASRSLLQSVRELFPQGS